MLTRLKKKSSRGVNTGSGDGDLVALSSGPLFRASRRTAWLAVSQRFWVTDWEAPLLNALLYQNSPRQLAVNRLLMDWADITEGVADFNPLKPFWADASLTPDVGAVSTFAQSAAHLAGTASRQRAVSDHIALLDRFFADQASELDDASDFGDF